MLGGSVYYCVKFLNAAFFSDYIYLFIINVSSVNHSLDGQKHY